MNKTTVIKRRPLTNEEIIEGLAIILRKLDRGSREIASVMFHDLADDLSPNAIEWRAHLLRVMAKEQPPTVDTRPKAPVINLADQRAKRQPAALKASKPRRARAVLLD